MPSGLRRGGDSRIRVGLDADAVRGPDGHDEAVASELADSQPRSSADGGTLLRRLRVMASDAGGRPRRAAHVPRAVVCVDTGVLGPRRATVRLRGDGRTCAAVQVHVPADLAGLLAHGHRLYGPSTGVGLARCRVRSGPDHRGLARPARGDGRVLRLDRHPRPRLLDVVRLPEAGGKGDPGSQRAEASGRNAPGCDYTASAAPSRLQWLLTTPREGGSGSIQAERAGCRASPDRSLPRRPWPALRRRPGRTT
jgi:hypothetical protein